MTSHILYIIYRSGGAGWRNSGHVYIQTEWWLHEPNFFP